MRKRDKKISEEDHILWEAVKKTAVPLRPDVVDFFTEEVSQTTKVAVRVEQPSLEKIKNFRMGGKSTKAIAKKDLMPSISDRLKRSSLQMDHKKYGKLRRGKLSPEAKIDLHGMTLAEAQPALTGFILSAHHKGLRLVLVITGKGKDRDEGGPIPVRFGVLKNEVPGWLSSGPMRLAVMQVVEAHLSHGGSGAYYVYLRRLP